MLDKKLLEQEYVEVEEYVEILEKLLAQMDIMADEVKGDRCLEGFNKLLEHVEDELNSESRRLDDLHLDLSNFD